MTRNSGSTAQHLTLNFTNREEVLAFIDDSMPIRLAFIDTEQKYRYHNRAFREWLGMAPTQINGMSVAAVLDKEISAEVLPHLEKALKGVVTQYNRSHRDKAGSVSQLTAHLIPLLSANGKVSGVFEMLLDVPGEATTAIKAPNAKQTETIEISPAMDVAKKSSRPPSKPTIAEAEEKAIKVQAAYQSTVVENSSQWDDPAARIRAALKNNEFCLFAQGILDVQTQQTYLYELFIRLVEEESQMMPPGAFFPLAESLGLMTEIDRWVVSAALRWQAERFRADPMATPMILAINLATDTIADRDFADHVQEQLRLYEIPGEALRFEIQELDVRNDPANAIRLVSELEKLGCESILCGFGRDKSSFALLKNLRVGFVKIDSSIILQVLRDESVAAKLTAIHRIATAVGIRTIGEFVESDAMIAKLTELKIDFVQGLGVASPINISQLN